MTNHQKITNNHKKWDLKNPSEKRRGEKSEKCVKGRENEPGEIRWGGTTPTPLPPPKSD